MIILITDWEPAKAAGAAEEDKDSEDARQKQSSPKVCSIVTL
jgi:hypothetical protein